MEPPPRRLRGRITVVSPPQRQRRSSNPTASPFYGQQEYGQQEYGQSYGQSAPNANPYAQPSPPTDTVPPTTTSTAAPTGAVPLNNPYYGCPFSEAFLRFWQKYTVFRGRASRSEFWWWTLAAVIINALLSLLGDVTDGRLDFLTSLWNLAIVVPGLALAVRRLHDTNKPGWWVAVFCGMMTLGLLIMIVGGGAALYGAIGAIGHNYDYGYGYGYEALATGGFGALAIGGLIMLASAVTGIVFMALPSKPEGARFDDDAAIGAAPQNAYGMPYGASAAPGFPAPGTPPKTSARPSPRMGRTHNTGRTSSMGRTHSNTGRLHNTHRPRNTARCRPNTRTPARTPAKPAEATCINGEARSRRTGPHRHRRRHAAPPCIITRQASPPTTSGKAYATPRRQRHTAVAACRRLHRHKTTPFARSGATHMVPFLARVPYHGLRRAGFDDIHHAAQNGVAQLHGRIRIIHAIHRPFAERHRLRLLQSRRETGLGGIQIRRPPQTHQTGVGYISHMQIGMQRGLIRHRNITGIDDGQAHRQRVSGMHVVCGAEARLRLVVKPRHFAIRQTLGIHHIPHPVIGEPLLIQRPPAHPCESVGWRNRQLPAMRESGPEPRKADRNPAAERLARFDAPCARRPHHIRLSCRGPAQQMRSVIADYRAAAIVDKRAQIDIVVHKSSTSIARTILFTP